jgi:hypothetical protein
MTPLRFLGLKAYYSPLAFSASGSKSRKRDLTPLISLCLLYHPLILAFKCEITHAHKPSLQFAKV